MIIFVFIQTVYLALCLQPPAEKLGFNFLLKTDALLKLSYRNKVA